MKYSTNKTNLELQYWSNIQNGIKFTFKRRTDNFKIMGYLSAYHSINLKIWLKPEYLMLRL